MNTTHSEDILRVLRRARFAALAGRLFAIAIPALVLASWIAGDAKSVALRTIGLDPGHMLEGGQLSLAIGLSLLPVLATAMSLRAVAQCFDTFARRDWFGSTRSAALASAGRWLVIAGGLSLVVPTFLGLVLSINAAPGSRVLTISLSSNAALAILFGVLLWVLSHLWKEAAQLAKENSEFV
ncbi:MAG: hypothetical protein HRU32_11445 [Rhodobacteraceae bacterium]|nr:hypothetical protein [Paracoccaceae bacterium]